MSKLKFSRILMAALIAILCFLPFSVEAEEIPLDYSVSFNDSATLTMNSYRSFVYFKEDNFPNVLSVLDNMPTDRFYKIKFQTVVDLTFDRGVYLNSLELNAQLDAFDGDVYHVSLVNFDQDDFDGSNSYDNIEEIQNGYFMVHNFTNYPQGYLPFKLNLSFVPRTTGDVQMNINVVLKIQSIEELTQSEAEIYAAAYETGFSDGQSQGFNQGRDYGYSVGYSQGSSDAMLQLGQYYDQGFEDGKNSVDSSGSYDQGFQDGQNSVDTNIFYYQGFEDGKNSVDLDSIYNAGYQAGMSSGYDQAYDQGYNQGLNIGYQQAYEDVKSETLDKLGSQGTTQGESFNVVLDLNIKRDALSYKDANTTLGSDVVYDHENSDYIDEIIHFDTLDESMPVYDFGFETDQYFYSYAYLNPQKLFTADPSAYAYRIDLQLSNTTYTADRVFWTRNMIGQWSDLMSVDAEIGLGFSNGSNGTFSYFITTDNLPVDIYSSVFLYYSNYFRFSDSDQDDLSYYASLDLKSKMTFTIIPYSRNEYAAMMENNDQNFDELKEALAEEFDDLKNGFDSSIGDQANNDLSSTMDEFNSVEDSLFTSSKQAMSDFEFFDFNSVPAMMTGVTFVTAMMTSIYNALGGYSGAGIVLSVLFSIMLVCLVIGFYKHYKK